MRKFTMGRIMSVAKLFSGLLLVGSLALAAPAMAQSQQAAAVPPVPASGQQNVTGTPDKVPGYRLGTGDKVRLQVFGEQELSGEYEVDDSGYMRLALVGQVQAAGLTIQEFEKKVKAALEDGYLVDPKISVEVINYRPFYIIGEVNKPGEYPYSSEMSILNAVAKAGGYTYRANQSDVYVRRNGATKEMAVPADQTTKIYPGDVIRIPERFF